MSVSTLPHHTERTASDIVAAIAARRTNAEEVAQDALARIAEREPTVQAWQYLDPDAVIARAREIDRMPAAGPLRGVPIGFKDIIDTADMPTEYGTSIHKGHRPRIDAASVALSRRAQANVFGKTVTTEFANRTPGKTCNPYDAARTPGGSSSGSGAAVGAGMVPLAVGTQTTSSTIRPAAFCGVIGYRPTYGDLRCHGVMEASGSIDTLGLFAHSIDDIALFRDVLIGQTHTPLQKPGRRAGSATPLAGLRIALAEPDVWQLCDTSTQNGLADCAERFAEAGATVTQYRLPTAFAGLEEAHRWISSFEFARNRAWEIDHHWEEISPFLRENRLRDGMHCTFETYDAARTLAAQSRIVLDSAFDDFDCFLLPAAEGEAPLGLHSTGNIVFCTKWSLLHVPAITLPLYRGPNGLPIGVQLVAKRGNDRALFSIAQALMGLYA